MSGIQKDAMKLTAAVLVFLLAIAALDSCIRLEPTIEESTWPESAEFSTLESGQDRFSAHGTNLDYWEVIVDHLTGCQYLARYEYGMTQLTDADGSPLLVEEAGE